VAKQHTHVNAATPPSVFALCGALLSMVAVGTLGATASTPTFLPAVPYDSAGNGPNSLAVADLNGDGKPDVVVCHYTSIAGYPKGALGVLLGNGDATFQPAVIYDSGGVYAQSVAVADVNGDGKPDLLVGNSFAGPGYGQGSGTVGVLIGRGDGTFEPAAGYDAGGILPSIAAADVNGDGKLDVLAANWGSNSVGVLLGNGDGTFRPVVTYDSGGKVPTSVAVGDANGDGKPDLLVANWWTAYQHIQNGAVAVLMGNGDGTFRPAVLYDSGGFGASSVASADVNGDGHQDLVVANCDATGTRTCSSAGTGHGVVGVLFGNGDGTFGAAVSYDLSGHGAGFAAVADVNGDAVPDVLVASCGSSSCSGSVGVLLGRGDGSFQPVVLYGSGGLGAASVGVADVNGDLRPDLLVATCATSSCSDGAVGVLVNTPAPFETAPTADAYVRAGAWSLTNFGSLPALLAKKGVSPDNTRRSYLKFDIGAIDNVGRATLRLYGHLSAGSTRQAQTTIYAVRASWDERLITWNTRPDLGAVVGRVVVSGTSPQWFEIDVTAFVRAEQQAGRHVVSLALRNVLHSSAAAEFGSRESGSVAPQLLIRQ
jgi:hypothetical protein